MAVLLRFASKLAAGEVAGLTHSMVPRPPRSFSDLARLCSIYNELELFLWLQQRFPPGNMMEEQAAIARKDLAISYIGDALALVSPDTICLGVQNS
jgi:Mitochondrial degradasome RNA helicase subunit C terminal